MNHLWIVVFCSLIYFPFARMRLRLRPNSQRPGWKKLRVAVDAPDLTLKELGGGSIFAQGTSREDHRAKLFRHVVSALSKGGSFDGQTSSGI